MYSHLPLSKDFHSIHIYNLDLIYAVVVHVASVLRKALEHEASIYVLQPVNAPKVSSKSDIGTAEVTQIKPACTRYTLC